MQSVAQQSAQDSQGNPIFRVQVVSRSIAAVTYRDRSGWTKIDFQGTSLGTEGKGQRPGAQSAGIHAGEGGY